MFSVAGPPQCKGRFKIGSSTTLHDFRSSAGESSYEPTKADEEKDLRKCERKSRHRAQPVLHVSSKPTSVTQCPQQ